MKILEFCKMEIFLALEFLKTLTKKQDNRSCRGKSLQNLYFSSRTYENPIIIYMKYIRITADLLQFTYSLLLYIFSLKNQSRSTLSPLLLKSMLGSLFFFFQLPVFFPFGISIIGVLFCQA